MAQADNGGWTTYMNQFTTRPMTMVAVGKTGKGKSSTLNSLIKWSAKHQNTINANINYFIEGDGPDSISDHVGSCEISPPGFPPCRLVDTIGLFDTKLTSKEQQKFKLMNRSCLDEEHKLVLQQFTKVMHLCQTGIDVFLFVVQANDRATHEEIETINIIFRYLGWSMLDYVIFVMTHKDTATRKSFEKWRDNICDILEEKNYPRQRVQDRFVFVDNKNPTDQQCYEILSLVRFVSDTNGGRPYTPAAFDEAQQALEQEKQRIKEKFEREFQNEVDKKVKPIEARHQAVINDLQTQIDSAIKAADQLRADQVEERQKYETKVNHLLETQEDEKRIMQTEMERQIKLLEQQKINGYEAQMKEMVQLMGDMMKSHLETHAQILQAISQLNQRQEDSAGNWWQSLVTTVVGEIFGKLFK